MSGGHPNRNKRGGGARSRHGPPRSPTVGKSASSGSSSASGANNGNGSNGNGSNGNGNGNKYVVSIPSKAPAATVVVRPPQPQPSQAAQAAQAAQATRSAPTTPRDPAPHQAPQEHTDTPLTPPATPFVVEAAPDETAPAKGAPMQERSAGKQSPRPRFERFYAPGQNGRNSQSNLGGQNSQRAQQASGGYVDDNGSIGATGATGQRRFSAPADMTTAYAPSAPRGGASSAGNGYMPAPAPAAPTGSTGTLRDEDDDMLVKPPPRDDVGKLIDALHAIFEQDRAIASQGSSQRCGVCFLHYPAEQLEYREGEGFYVCPACKRSLGNGPLMMVRRQQR